MPRNARHAPGGLIYHVLNHAAGGAKLFTARRNFEPFQGRNVPICRARDLAYLPVQKHLGEHQ